jgi:hypothetical protein
MIELADAGDKRIEEGLKKERKIAQCADMPVSRATASSTFQQQQQQQQHAPPRQMHAHASTRMIPPSAMLQYVRDYCYQSPLDIEMLLITLLLFLFSILVLSPRASLVRGVSLRKRRCTPGDNQNLWGLEDDSEGVSSNRTITTNSSLSNTGARDNEDISDEEQFEQLWPAVRTSAYRRLVLPPECRLVDIPAFVKQQREEESKAKQEAEVAAAAASAKNTEDDDHPLTRLKGYADDLFHLLRNFLSYDYMEAGKMLIHWMQYWLRLKSRKAHKVDDDDDEDDDEDMSISTEGNDKRIERMDLSLFDDPQQNAHRRESSASEYGSVMSQESLEGTPQHNKPPLSPRRLGRVTSTGKKKDALVTYRSSAATSTKLPVVTSSANTTSNSESSLPLTPKRVKPSPEPPPMSPEMTTPRQKDSVSDDYETSPRTRIFSGSMSFFDTAHNKASLRRMHVEVPVPDR